MASVAWSLYGYAPVRIQPGRALSIESALLCPACRTLHFGAEYVTGEVFCKCQHKRCLRQRWWATVLYPGSIGATLIAVFGSAHWRDALTILLPATVGLSEDDALATDLPSGYLELPLTAHEYTRGVADAMREGRDRLARLAKSA